MSQSQLRTAQELQDHMEEYIMLSEGLSELFEWLASTVRYFPWISWSLSYINYTLIAEGRILPEEY